MDDADAPCMLELPGLRLTWTRRGDRYAHTLWVRDGDGGPWQAALESLEGSPAEPWPPSPPLQQLHVERRAAGPVALLVGQAGRSHWSLSVEVRAADGAVVFDAACRFGGEPAWLGSRYRVIDPAAASRLAVGPLDGSTRVDFPAMRAAADNGPAVWTIGPELGEPRPPTIRWGYSIQPPPSTRGPS